MDEEKIDQILKNQAMILLALSDDGHYDLETFNAMTKSMSETKDLLNPKEEPTIKEQTKKFFGCGKKIMVKDGKSNHESFCGCTYRGLHLCYECQETKFVKRDK